MPYIFLGGWMSDIGWYIWPGQKQQMRQFCLENSISWIVGIIYTRLAKKKTEVSQEASESPVLKTQQTYASTELLLSLIVAATVIGEWAFSSPYAAIFSHSYTLHWCILNKKNVFKTSTWEKIFFLQKLTCTQMLLDAKWPALGGKQSPMGLACQRRRSLFRILNMECYYRGIKEPRWRRKSLKLWSLKKYAKHQLHNNAPLLSYSALE